MMLDLPKSTEFNKRIPKQSFYENLDVSPSIKKYFVEQIKTIYWKNKISPETMNLAPGEIVTELQVFEIRLSSNELDESVLSLIDKKIPYHILFILEYNGKYQAWTAYKEAVSGNNAFKVGTYYHTEWLCESELLLKIEGLNIDKVYENLVRQIAGELLRNDSHESLKESVDRERRKQELKKQIETLQQKVRREKQLNKQMKLNSELKKIKKELEEL
ncbi:DUF4391 domain-containing protein [Butyrivibrio sp. LC3010]|uniref:DUF4391 domain-containing protein n=1 Tax=Butyrivibrio sp. LC3010 TaxID=1280680 RepID=UPI001FA79AD5|nr:DUF4391 domain-containing protein [Butyrivibrio sp. LC3010]